MKQIKTFALLLIVTIACSCSQSDELVQSPLSSIDGDKKTMTLKLGNILQKMQSTAINEFGICAYSKGILVGSANGMISNDTNGTIELPLDESVTLFAYANAGQITSSDTLAKVQLQIGDQGQNEVFISESTVVVSNNSVTTVNLEMNRIVGQIVFEPIEDTESLNAVTQFDAIDVNFINAGVNYLPGNKSSIQDTLTVRSTKAEGFKASVYSFPTFNGNPATLEVIYYKDGQIVNKTVRALAVAINVEPSKRSVVYMPLLNEDYLLSPFGKRSSPKTSKPIAIVLKEFQF